MLRQSWAASARWGTRATSCRLARARLLGQGQGHGRERDEDTARRVVYFGRARARPSAGRGAVLTYGDDPRRRDREGIGRKTPPSYGGRTARCIEAAGLSAPPPAPFGEALSPPPDCRRRPTKTSVRITATAISAKPFCQRRVARVTLERTGPGVAKNVTRGPCNAPARAAANASQDE